MKKVILWGILSILFVITQSVNAQDKFINEGDVDVKSVGDFFEISATGRGQGVTLESAKLEAMNSFMPLLVAKTKNLASSRFTSMTENGEKIEVGVSSIAAKIFVKDHWNLKNGIYDYEIIFIIINTE